MRRAKISREKKLHFQLLEQIKSYKKQGNAEETLKEDVQSTSCICSNIRLSLDVNKLRTIFLHQDELPSHNHPLSVENLVNEAVVVQIDSSFLTKKYLSEFFQGPYNCKKFFSVVV